MGEPLIRVVVAVPPHSAWTGRLRRLAAGLGWRLEPAHGGRDLLQRLSHPGEGLVLIARSVLGPPARASAQLARLRERAPGQLWIVLASSGDLSAGAVSELLSCGADDVLSEVLTERTLEAKLKAFQGRLARFAEKSSALIRADASRRKIFVRDKRGAWRQAGGLSPKEFQLCCFFLRHPGRTLEREALLSAAWHEKAREVNPETIGKHVQSLRRKLGRHGRLIRTVHGRGYAFHPPAG